MKGNFRIRSLDLMIVGALAAFIAWKGAHRSPASLAQKNPFADQINLEPFDRVSVQADGRLRSFESHAKTYMGFISGPHTLQGQSYGFSYFDLVFNPERYENINLIYVKNKQVRQQILDAVKQRTQWNESARDEIQRIGLISKAIILLPEVGVLLDRLGKDLIRTSKVVDAIQSALTVSTPRFLTAHLRVVAPPEGDLGKPWISIDELVGIAEVPQDAIHAGAVSLQPIAGLDNEFRNSIRENWLALQKAWRSRDAASANAAIARLAELFPKISPQLHPSPKRLAMESWYFRSQSMTWIWCLYLAAVVPLLMSLIYHWNRARTIGMVLFVLAFLAHTTSLGIRWYISGRWPNANMFEAVTTSAWFGGVVAIILEGLTRRTPFRNLFALGSSVASMAALMAAYFLPAELDSGLSNKMAALNDVWLYIHTNMIILSYALIGLACVTALLQLRHRWCLAWDREAMPKIRLLSLPIAVGVLNFAAYKLLMHLIDYVGHGLERGQFLGYSGALGGAAMIVLYEILAARSRVSEGRVGYERSSAGGAGTLILGPSRRNPFLQDEGPTMSQVLDGATMVLMELSFLTLFTGTIMGAIWADHSWGRPWGWDPKEVFALNTFFILVILIHVRVKVRDKGFWTAVLAVLGFEVMMFNWIVINFIVTGLHSYA